MSKKAEDGGRRTFNNGYATEKKGYQPASSGVTGGHKPETAQVKPHKPPKKR